MTVQRDDQTFEALRAEALRLLNEEGVPGSQPVPDDPAGLLRELLRQRQELLIHQVELRLQNEELLRASHELEHARKEYEDLFDLAPVGYLTIDENALIGRANLRVCQMLGIERPRLLRRRFSAFLDPAESTTFTLFLRRVLERQERRTIELWLVGANGERFAAQLEAVPIENVQRDVRHCRLTVTDITPQRHAQDEVLRLNATLEERVERRTRHIQELSRELETFVFSVSHDLMTPLRHIRSFTKLLVKDVPDLDEKHQRYAGHVEHSADRMEAMLQALLTFFRSGQQRIHFKPVDLNRVLREIQKDLATAMEGRDVHLTVDDLPTVQGDSLTLQLAFANLLENALKFTRGRSPARIEVTASTTATEFVIGVRDNGAGFNMRQRDRLFGVFQRLHREEDFEGTGVGLALVRRIVLRHGGRVWAEGKPNQGATFWVSLPRVPPGQD